MYEISRENRFISVINPINTQRRRSKRRKKNKRKGKKKGNLKFYKRE
jgi:hypothetical protein